MSGEATGWAWKQRGLSVYAKVVLARLCDLANHDNECWPSQARIAADCCITRETVNRAIKQLVEARLIENRPQTQNGVKLVSRYFIRCDADAHRDVIPTHIETPISDVRPTHNNNLLLEVIDSEEAKASPGADAPPAVPIDPVKDLWDRGKAILGKQGASLIGQMISLHGRPAVLGAIVACETEPPIGNVAAYFIRCCEDRRRDAPRNYHETPLGNLFEGARRAAEAYNARQSRRDISDREPPFIALLDGNGTRSDPTGTG